MADPVLGPTEDQDLYKVVIRQRLYNQRLLNVLWYRVSDAGGAPPDRWQMQIAVANQMGILDGVIDKMIAAQTDDLLIQAVTVSSYRTPLDRKPYGEVNIGINGSVAVAAGDANTAASIEKRANVPIPGHPRYGIGRFQLGGIPADQYTAGLFEAPYQITLQELADVLTESFVVLGVTFVPVLVNTDGASFVLSDIFGAAAKDTVRVMRRRTVGVGE